ncbi:acylphosphatase [Geobacter sp. AOG2]|uniref:acylphosphatase n=1 Tax=Geobacter sp. AOG2 TaxID=1566347 RepID=UPI001CC40A73|nr:acylphosphatase [Geobacter sp. AOG2]GFE62339.1 acylphosphatase [Geobacter sp. AOG2]
MNIRVSVTVFGRVQGVAFRHYTRLRAMELGVNGWVKNLSDGSVAGVFEGDENAVNSLVGWCRQGPPAAEVERLDLHREISTGEFEAFSIR